MNKFLPGLILVITSLITTPVFATDSLTPTSSPITTRETIKDTREQMRTKLKDTRETYKAEMLKARDEFKAKLKTIKDVKKQATVERIDARLAEVNTKRTDAMSQALTHLSTLLERIASKTAAMTPAPSIDISLITTARTKISTAQQAVATQVAKEYIITLSTTEPLKTSVLTTITALKTDLKTTDETVMAARTAVIAALKTMTSAIKEPTITPEGVVTN